MLMCALLRCWLQKHNCSCASTRIEEGNGIFRNRGKRKYGKDFGGMKEHIVGLGACSWELCGNEGAGMMLLMSR